MEQNDATVHFGNNIILMGPMNESEVKAERIRLTKQQIKERNLKEIEDIYSMFDQTIEVVLTNSRLNIKQSSLSPLTHNNRNKTSKISNLESVLDQLLESFLEKSNYSWGKQINARFKAHFLDCFEDIWPINKEQFYEIVLKKCKFDTADLQKQIRNLAFDMNIEATPSRISYQRYFYDVETEKIEKKHPLDPEQDTLWQQDLKNQSEEEQRQYHLNAINSSILNDEYLREKHIFINIKREEEPEADSDFLPLFITSNNSIGEPKNKLGPKPTEGIRSARIQNSSLLIPETVFLDRMSLESKAEASDLVKFYREWANALQQMFESVNLISVPFKHFLYIFKENIKRKNIYKKSQKIDGKKSSRSTVSELLFQEDEEGRKYRLKRGINNAMLLEEIKDFSDAYTEFVWKFLQLYEISESKLGKLINIDTLYGIVLKSIWKYVEWIGDRGCEYEEKKLESLHEHEEIPNRTKIPTPKKDYLFQVMKTLCGERNPQKYLKKVVIFYRETSKVCSCADDLVNIYEELIIRLIKQGRSQQLAIFRMRKVVEQLLKINDSCNMGGEISYSWTTWCVLVELLYAKIEKPHKFKFITKHAPIEMDDDYENVQLEH